MCKLSQLIIGLLLFCMLCVPFAQSDETEEGGRRTLVFGVRHDDLPLQGVQNGWPSGFDVELGRLLAEKVGMHIVFRVDTRPRLWQDLRSGGVDIIADVLSSVGAGDEFITLGTVCRLGYALYVPADSTISGLGDIAGCELIVVDPYPLKVLEKRMISPGRVISVTDVNDALKLLVRSRYDAALLSRATAESAMLDMNIEGVRRLGEIIWEEDYGYLLSPLRGDIAGQLTEALEDLRRHGRLDKLAERWLLGAQRQAFWRTIKWLLAGIGVLAALLLLSLFWSGILRGQVLERSRALKAQLRERKAVENALRDSQRRLTTLFDGIDDGLLVHDVDGNILDCNDVLCRRLGYSREELLRMKTTDIDAADFAGGFKNRLELQFKQHRYRCEGAHRTSDGRVIPVDIMTSLIEYNGRPAVLAAVRDISEKVQRENEHQNLLNQMQHTQKLESMGVLAGGIAHDFNNLLMGMLGNADLALDQLPSASPAIKELKEIQVGIRRAADLCRQMLAYSGKGRFVIEAVDLNRMVEEMANLLVVSVSKRAELRYNFSAQMPPIEADSTQLRQVIMNLITNASDAMDGHDGIITITTGTRDCSRTFLKNTYVDDHLPEGKYAFVQVVDNGYGMSKETLEKLFDPFYTTKATGRGLGLAAVLGIIRGHKGAVKVQSEEGRGTTFSIFFPVAENAVLPEQEDHFDWKSWRGSGCVLLVDDEETVRNVGRRMLERVGFKVLLAADGLEAMEIFKKRKRNLACVILDMSMPHMDGEEAFLAIRQIVADMPVILSSGYNRQSVVSDFTDSGPTGFLQKPYQVEQMVRELRLLLS